MFWRLQVMLAILKAYGAVVCRFRGHMRGIRIRNPDRTLTDRLECPRCKAQWERPIAKRKVRAA